MRPSVAALIDDAPMEILTEHAVQCIWWEQNRAEYERFTKRLKGLIWDLLEPADNGLEILDIQARAKSQTSFEDKSLEKLCLDPAWRARTHCGDLSGIRVILYSKAKVPLVQKLLADEFEVIQVKEKMLDPSQTGYRAKHLIVRTHPSRSGLAEWQRYKDFVAEIQVRSAAEQACYEVLHLVYKGQTIDKDLERSLYRAIGTVEQADEVFSNVIAAVDQIRAAQQIAEAEQMHTMVDPP